MLYFRLLGNAVLYFLFVDVVCYFVVLFYGVICYLLFLFFDLSVVLVFFNVVCYIVVSLVAFICYLVLASLSGMFRCTISCYNLLFVCYCLYVICCISVCW